MRMVRPTVTGVSSLWKRRCGALACLILAGAPGGWGFVGVMSRALGGAVSDPWVGAAGGACLGLATALLLVAWWLVADEP